MTEPDVSPEAELDATHDPARRSWVDSANDGATDFPIQNLPLGIFAADDGAPRFGIAIGAMILDIGAALRAGLLTGEAEAAARAGAEGAARGEGLNALFALGRPAARALRGAVADLLDAATAEGKAASAKAGDLLHAQSGVTMLLPSRIGDYTDFFAGIHHARAAGALMRPNDPLPVNYKYVPIAYHGRASSVRVGGGTVKRPTGQLPTGGAPRFGACEKFDLELEMGFYIGPGNDLGQPIPIAEARDRIVGMCLLNDWSARDIQRWEMVPLGPFLAKSLQTSVSPWVITADALAPFRVAMPPRPEGDPAPLPYLTHRREAESGGLDIALAVHLQTAKMRAAGSAPEKIIHSNAKHLYWSLGQMVAHHTSNGCDLRPGDLIGTGTISGPVREELSSMLELTYGGTEPVTLASGEMRSFLEDGDRVIFTARCSRAGFASIGFGECAGTVTG